MEAATDNLDTNAGLRPALLRLDHPMTGTPPNGRTVVENEHKTHKFHTTRRYPIYYLAITKCGSTYLKNLLYYLDHDRMHPAPAYIHDYHQDFLRADLTPRWMLRRSRFAFTVLRRPSSRFLSLYFDKIWGDHPQNFPDIREDVADEADLDLSRDLDAKAHRENCTRFLKWIEANLAHDTDQPINPHWRPQTRRIAQVEHLAPSFLTLDGLDWQLPLYLGPVIPDIRAKMQAVSVKNSATYPVDPDDVLDDRLEDAINTVYAEDFGKYRRASRRWADRRDRPAAPRIAESTARTIHVLSTHRFNLNTITQPKAGISYIRNLHYALDHGRMHPQPHTIDDDGCLVGGLKSADELEDGVNIVVLRDPISRFFSLYFDKIWAEDTSRFGWIGQQLRKNRRLATGPNLSEAEHHDNCCRLLGFLETRFRERKVEDLNPHWRPQALRARDAANFGFTPILLEDFAHQISTVAEGRIRGLGHALDTVTYKNRSIKPIDPETLKSPWILDRLHALYGDDIALYERIKAGWQSENTPPSL